METGLAKKIAIMQPAYMPWAGFFNLISRADVFVFLDNVQYERQSWQNRNRVLLEGAAHWLTVPCRRQNLEQILNTIEVDDRSHWREKHFKLVSQAYAKHPYVGEVLEIMRLVADESVTHLAELNMNVIKTLAGRLGLTAQFVRSSDLNISGERSDRLVRICEHFGCQEYLSPAGSADYLAEDGAFEGTSVRLSFQDYQPAPYPQLKQQAFISHLSVLDILANLGIKQTCAYIQGRFL